MTILTWASENPWLAALVVVLIYHLAVRCFRLVNIGLRGWPPPYLDADGDFKREKPNAEESA